LEFNFTGKNYKNKQWFLVANAVLEDFHIFTIVGRSEMLRLCMFHVKKGAVRRLSYGRARAYFTIVLTDYCASYMTNKARGC